MRFISIMPSVMMLPALFQVHGVGGAARATVPIEDDAREFMRRYAEDLRRGRRRAIADRYDRRGAYRVGEGEKTLEEWDLILAAYLTQWTPPETFGWKGLSFETINDDAIVVIGLFDWGLADGRKLSFSYTGLLVRQDGELRIRLEDESMSPRALASFNGSSPRN